MTEKVQKKNDGNRLGCDFGEMTGIIGKMTGKSTWKVSGMESFYILLVKIRVRVERFLGLHTYSQRLPFSQCFLYYCFLFFFFLMSFQWPAWLAVMKRPK